MLSGHHPLNETPLGEREEGSLLALARSELERGEEKVLCQHNGPFILLGQVVQAIKLSAKQGHYWFGHGSWEGGGNMLF